MKSAPLTELGSIRTWIPVPRSEKRRVAWPMMATASVAYLAALTVNTFSIMAEEAMLPARHALASDISVVAPPVFRSSTGSEIEVRVRHANGRPVTVSLGSGFVAGSTLKRISPLPSSSKIGPSGIELGFATGRDSDLRVVIEATPEATGRMTYELGVMIGDDISATTLMSHYVLPW